MVVTEDALYKRINRKLKKVTWAQVLKRTRGERARQDLGDYFTLDVSRNIVTDSRVNLEDLEKELGVLNPHETVEWKDEEKLARRLRYAKGHADLASTMAFKKQTESEGFAL